MSEGTSSSESASATAEPGSTSPPANKGRNLWMMIAAIVVVIALVATAFVVMPKKEGKGELTAKILGDVLEVDAGTTNNMTVVVMMGKTDVSNNTETTKIFWRISPATIGSFLLKSRPEVPFKAAITAGTGTVRCEIEYKETPESDAISIVAEKAITVLPPYLDGVSISPTAKTIEPGESWTFTATAVSSVGLPISGVEFTWSVTPDSLVTLSATTGSTISVDAGTGLGDVTLNATGSYSGKTKTGTSTITVGYLPPRSMDYVWYDMFNVPIGSFYYKRWEVYKQEDPISTEYPWIFLYHSSPPGNLYLYSLMRLNITGRNVSEINMNTWPEFLPILSQTERGGTAEIDWYMQYLTSEELDSRYSSFASQDDGWIIVLNGTVSLDKQAAKTVLNLTEGGYETFDRWWSENQATVVGRYSDFIVNEAEIRLDIENAYESYYQLFTFVLDASKVGDKIVLRYDLVTWGMEALMMRWLHECFLPIEMWYEDMNIHMTIGPEWADIDIDTAVTYSLFATETIDSMGKTDVMPCWVMTPLLGDAVESTDAHPHSDLDRYLPYSYLNRQPDSPLYGTYMQYDVVPVAWNLTENETLKIQWPSGQVPFRYRIAQGVAVNISEEMVVDYSEPGPTDFSGVTIDNTAREVSFVGPINMYDWSQNQTAYPYLADEWDRINMLPYSLPMVEFQMKNPVHIYLDHFEVSTDTTAPANDDVTVKVTAINNYGFTYYGYEGTVNFTSSDSLAALPANYTFIAAADQGVRTFVGGAKFQTEGAQTITVVNVSADLPLKQGQTSLTVTPIRNASSMDVSVYYVPAIGVAEDITVTVYDQYGDLFLNYTGTVTFASNKTSGDVTLPADYPFQLSDAGIHTIVGGITFLTSDWFNVSASDLDRPSAAGWNTNIWVAPSPEEINHFTMTGIKDMLTRQKSDVKVTAYDQYGKLFMRYTGTVHFSANASGAVLPADYTFVTDDDGYKEFSKSVSFSLPGVFTVTVADTVYTVSAGNQTNIVIEYRPASQTFKIYDMFEEPWGEFMAWKFKGYSTDIILTNESGKYTMIYNPDGRSRQGIIYAPYRWNITGTNLSQVSVHNPEFMPVLGTPDVAGARASIDVYFQYLDWNWWNTYWKPVWNMPDSIMQAQITDGYYPGVLYTVKMNREAALEWLGMPTTANPNLWWAVNGGKYLANWSAWIDYEGNNRLDIWAGYEWPYIDAGTKMRLSVLPDGDLQLLIGHMGMGYEILMTRWFNETNLCNHEAYFEDMSYHVDYFDKWIDLQFDAACQYSLRAVKANESATNEPAWAWEPLLIDYVPQWKTPGGLHKSKFDLWANLKYRSWNAGDPLYGRLVPYDAGLTYFNLSDYQKLVIQLPADDNNIGFLAQPMPVDAISRIRNGGDPYLPYPEGDGSKSNLTAYTPLMVNGTMELGWYGNWTGAPVLDDYYNPVTKVLTLQGPMSFDNWHQPNSALYRGAPWIEFNVTPVSGLLSVPTPASAPPTQYSTESAGLAISAETIAIAAFATAMVSFVAVIAVISRRKD